MGSDVWQVGRLEGKVGVWTVVGYFEMKVAHYRLDYSAALLTINMAE